MAKIIIVDDDPNVRDVLSRMLNARGHTVMTSADGLNAILLIKNNIADIVVLDRNIPFATGEKVFKKIKELSRAIKVIILTGYDDEESKENYLEMGASLFISKSEGLTNIINKIESLSPPKNISQPSSETSILVADDDNYTREFLKKFLTSKGYKVFTAADGMEALNIVKENRISLILLDIFMPRLDGKGVLYELKKLKAPPLIVVISGNEDERLAIEFLKEGAMDYIKKPVDLEKLDIIIRTLTL